MNNSNSNVEDSLDCLLVFVPKLKNIYRPIGEHMFTVLLPMGLLSIADYIYRQGFSVNIVHFGLEKINNPHFSLEDYLKSTNPKVVGLSLHWHYQCYDTIKIAKQIKLFNPNIFVVIGGLTASYFHEEILQGFSFIDAVIRGDGERPFDTLVKKISTGCSDFSSVPNLTWRAQEKIIINEISYVIQDKDLNELNFTNFKLLKNYKLYIKMKDFRGGRWTVGTSNISKIYPPAYFPLLIHKGCYFNCSYCGGSKISQKLTSERTDISIRSITKVVDSIKEAQRYGYKEIMIPYLHFVKYPSYFEELFDLIREENIEMNYFLECWVLPSKSVIKAFKSLWSGRCKNYIGISPETGSEYIRKVNKGMFYTNSELIGIINYINSLGIPLILYFSVGLPFETADDVKDTLEFQQYLRKKFKNIIGISTVNPVLEPASPMYINPEYYEIVKTRNSFKNFIQSSGEINKFGFVTPKLGYFKPNFSKPKRFACLSQEEVFRRDLQGIICRNSCRISDFVFSKFSILNNILTRKLIILCSRLICGIIFVISKISFTNYKENKKI
ncbi:MAG: cobalamin-dependent protein [Candidatus Omnitrophica bacterium]|nr:cobalamin-dependent protein [Candidatus Omnitrophota bacterium]